MIKIFKTSKKPEDEEVLEPVGSEEDNGNEDIGSLVERFKEATYKKIRDCKDSIGQINAKDKKRFRRFNLRLAGAFLIYIGLSLATGYVLTTLNKRNEQGINNLEGKQTVLAQRVKGVEDRYDPLFAKLDELQQQKQPSVYSQITFAQNASQSIQSMNEEQKVVVATVVNHTDNWIKGNWEQYTNDYTDYALIETMRGIMNKEQLYEYKVNLNKRNTERSIEFQSPFEIKFENKANGRYALLTFLQSYDSTSYADLCDKFYELKKVGDEWLISKESFKLHQIVKNVPYKKNPNKVYFAK